MILGKPFWRQVELIVLYTSRGCLTLQNSSLAEKKELPISPCETTAWETDGFMDTQKNEREKENSD